MESRAVKYSALIETTFLQTLVDDPGAVVVLDGVDELPEGYRIRSHDLRGPLRELSLRTTVAGRVDDKRESLRQLVLLWQPNPHEVTSESLGEVFTIRRQ